MICPICETRKAKRFCPAKGETICAICCGEKREVTIDCPSNCAHLIGARTWQREHRRPIDPNDVPYPNLTIPAGTIHDSRPLISALSFTILKAWKDAPSLDDSGVIDALAALAETYRTLETGLYYERQPDGPMARVVYERLAAFLAELKKAEQQQTGFGGMKDSTTFQLMAFLLRVAKYESNGRPRSRAFLDFLRAQFPHPADEPAEPSRIIVP